MGCCSSKNQHVNNEAVVSKKMKRGTRLTGPQEFIWICTDAIEKSIIIRFKRSALPTTTYQDLVDEAYRVADKAYGTDTHQVKRHHFVHEPEDKDGGIPTAAEVEAAVTGNGAENLIDRQPFHFRLAMEKRVTEQVEEICCLGPNYEEETKDKKGRKDKIWVAFDRTDTVLALKEKLSKAMSLPDYKKLRRQLDGENDSDEDDEGDEDDDDDSQGPSCSLAPEDMLLLCEGVGELKDDTAILNDLGITSQKRISIRENMGELEKGENEDEAFVDMSNPMGTDHLELKEESPGWRKACRGLNLEGPCPNEKCEAFEKTMVLMPWGYGTFDYLNCSKDPKLVCPMPKCKTRIEPITCGFVDCFYRFFGVQKLPDQPPTKKIQQIYKRVPVEYQRFNEYKAELVEWLALKIRVRHKNEGNQIKCPYCLKPLTKEELDAPEEMTCKHVIHAECKKKLAQGQLAMMTCAMCKM